MIADMLIIVSDHAGFDTKEELLQGKFFDSFDDDVVDLNPELESSDDYPDIVESVTQIDGYKKSKIIAFCGSGQGVCMALNKLPDIRAGLGYSLDASQIIRTDNNANAICFGTRSQSVASIKENIVRFMNSTFSTENRHHRRVEKLDNLSKISHK